MEVAKQWKEWVAENLLLGASNEQVHSTLIEQGLPSEVGSGLIQETLQSAAFQAARRLNKRRGLEQTARLVRHFHNSAFLDTDQLDLGQFSWACWFAHKPCVFRGGAAHFPAMNWTFDSLSQRVGAVEIEVLRGRTRYKQWWKHRQEISEMITMAELCDIAVNTEGNDVYAVGRNDVLATKGLETLNDDIGLLPGITAERPHNRIWIGPAGTYTPMHHDQSGAWLVQILGSKTVWMASPLEPSMLDTAMGVFNSLDPRQMPKNSEIYLHKIELNPGDAVFFPTGWWHAVLATAPSLSISLGRFIWPNNHSWYVPGRSFTS